MNQGNIVAVCLWCILIIVSGLMFVTSKSINRLDSIELELIVQEATEDTAEVRMRDAVNLNRKVTLEITKYLNENPISNSVPSTDSNATSTD